MILTALDGVPTKGAHGLDAETAQRTHPADIHVHTCVGIDYVDLNFLGNPEIIATAVLQGAAGVALIDPGPSTTLDNLRAALRRKGIGIADVRQLLLTHIHLDHAGSPGRSCGRTRRSRCSCTSAARRT